MHPYTSNDCSCANTKPGKLKGNGIKVNEYNERIIVLVFDVWHERDAAIRSILSVVRAQFGDVGAHKQCMHDVGCVSVCEFGRSVSLHTGKSFICCCSTFGFQL